MASLAAKLSAVFSLAYLFLPTSPHAASVEQMQFLMGTTARVRVWAPDSSSCHLAIDSVFAAFHQVDRDMSTYKPDSHISHLNRDGHTDWVDLSPSLVHVLDTASDYHVATQGAFDPTVLPLMRLWGFRGGTPAIPSTAMIDSTLEVVGYEQVEIDRSGSRGRFKRPRPQLDLGGIAKGYALDAGKAAALKFGATAGWFDLGGNVISFGAEAEGHVGIQDPHTGSGIVGRVWLAGGSIATSGGYERFVEIEGRRFGHVIDPRNGQPVDHTLSATVVMPDGIQADAFSTACFVLRLDACRELVEDHGGGAVLVTIESDSMVIDVVGDVSLIR